MRRGLVSLGCSMTRPTVLSPRRFNVPRRHHHVCVIYEGGSCKALSNFDFPVTRRGRLRVGSVVSDGSGSCVPLGPSAEGRLRM